MIHRSGLRAALLRDGNLGGSAVHGRVPGPPSAQSKDTVRADRDLVATGTKPLLLVDIDGVISLFRTPLSSGGNTPVEGAFHSIEGIPHFLSATAAGHLLELASLYDLVWCSGWEERADEHLPHLLGVPARLPVLRFDRDVGGGLPHHRPPLDPAAKYTEAGAAE